MPHYQVYGYHLESDIPFPDLPTFDGADAPRWRVRQAAALPPMEAARELGREALYDQVQASLVQHQDGFRITVDDTGEFDIGALGVITCAPYTTARPDFVRAHLLGRVIATAMYHEGWLPLHGSAVLTREGVVAFLGPKGMGKSSLAAALVGAGAALVTDDTFPVEPSSPPLAWPGVHTLRVHEDVRAALALAHVDEDTGEHKRLLAQLAPARQVHRPQPIAALYLLCPADDENREAAAVRTSFSPVLAAAAVTAHVKTGRMLGPGAASAMLERAARLVHLVPVHQLSVTRRLERLPEVAQVVLDWYGGPPR
ncbi:MAG: hypothetical protein KF709_05995 [Gemmatimonadaceae bacterium]|nr:hypothetical protein [Gemmatimonadaceae bacterium]